MFRAISLVGLLIFAAPGEARATKNDDIFKSQIFVEMCENGAFSCIALIHGIHMATYNVIASISKSSEMTQKLNEIYFGCSPADVSVNYDQRLAIWHKFLLENPDQWHFQPAVTYSKSMLKAFPCK